jgi:hypothetical protein
MVLKLIQTKTIAALGGMDTPGSTTLQYHFDPMIHHNLTGNPTIIIGNLSNKQGGLSLVKIDVASFCLLPYIVLKHTFNTLLSHGDELTEELLSNTTDLKTFDELIVATLIPKFQTTLQSTMGRRSHMVTLPPTS